jgi:hypothetical protein
MIKPKQSAEQQVADEADRRALNPIASRQTISDSQADPEFQKKPRAPESRAAGSRGGGAEVEEMTFASHPERQFMQYLRGAGWIKAGALPPSARLLEKLLQKGWIERQEQGPKNEVFFRLTDRGLEAKKSPVPSGRTKP